MYATGVHGVRASLMASHATLILTLILTLTLTLTQILTLTLQGVRASLMASHSTASRKHRSAVRASHIVHVPELVWSFQTGATESEFEMCSSRSTVRRWVQNTSRIQYINTKPHFLYD